MSDFGENVLARTHITWLSGSRHNDDHTLSSSLRYLCIHSAPSINGKKTELHVLCTLPWG